MLQACLSVQTCVRVRGGPEPRTPGTHCSWSALRAESLTAALFSPPPPEHKEGSLSVVTLSFSKAQPFKSFAFLGLTCLMLQFTLANVKGLLFLILFVMIKQFQEPSLFYPFSVTRVRNCEFSSVFVQISNKMKWNCNFYSPFSLPAVAFKKILMRHSLHYTTK